MTSKKSYSYCFTLNNYTAVDDEQLKALEADSKVRYLLYGKEVGEQGTPHYQGYIYYHNRVVFNTLKKALPRANISAARGTVQQNYDYCTKSGDFYEFGDRPLTKTEQGKRGREYWDEQLSLAKKGKVEECDSKLQITHHHALHSIAAKYAPMPPDNDDVDNFWYYGETGTGKSKKARTENPGAYLKLANKWWDGYTGQEVVIIEDFDKSHKVLGYHFKIWGDRYAFPAEVKGSKLNLRPKKIIVTSNWSPREIWGDEPQTLGPIERRFKLVQFFKQLNQASP